MLNIVAVGIGGCVGAIARYMLSGMIQRRVPDFAPAGTLFVNVLGCLLIGMLLELARREILPHHLKLALVTGCLGSLTTFSTFGHETISLLQSQNLHLAMMNVSANLIVGCFAVVAGQALVAMMLR